MEGLKDEITISCRHTDLYPRFLLLCQLPDSIQNRFITLHENETYTIYIHYTKTLFDHYYLVT